MISKRMTFFLLMPLFTVFLSHAKAAPAPRKVIRDSIDAPMVLIPEGWFLMGSNEGNDNEFPRRRVFLGAYYIDKYPVTNRRYRGPRSQEYPPPFSEGRYPATGIT